MELIIGDNHIFPIPVVDSEGAPLDVATLSKLHVHLIQHDRVKAVYTLLPGPADSEIRISPDADTSFEVELTKDLSGSLKKGELFLKSYETLTDALFIVDGESLNIRTIKLCDMI